MRGSPQIDFNKKGYSTNAKACVCHQPKIMTHTPDLEDIQRKVHNIITRDFPRPSRAEAFKYKRLILEILSAQSLQGKAPLDFKTIRAIERRHGYHGRHSFLLEMFDILAEEDAEHDHNGLYNKEVITRALRIKRGKSHSGINSITILMSPYPEFTDTTTGESKRQAFSCKWNCSYCPNDPNAPRSYLSLEPAVLRSIKNDFSVCGQMWDRMNGLYRIGHRKITKLEIIVEGGTVSNYPIEYRDQFARDIYYAANTYWDDSQTRRIPRSLEDEKRINQTAKSRVIGLTYETRPDEITPEELIVLRRHGCTRVQLGVQHLDQDVLDKINRKCTTRQVKHAIRLLKDVGFKIDIHIMPNLPGSSAAKDRHMMLDRLLGTRKPFPSRCERFGESWERWDLAEPDLSADQWKIYPCAVVPFTEIEQWFKAGTYVPYAEDALTDLLIETMTCIYPWIRCNRMIRDIPADYYHSDTDPSARMRQEVEKLLQEEGKCCMDIRNREVKGAEWNGMYKVVVREYEASQGIEVFVSAESDDQRTLYGFVRLRLSKTPRADVFPELQGCAFVRELHVHGDLQEQGAQGQHIQHRGIGTTLLKKAEAIAREAGYAKIAVIAGEGTKEYYRVKHMYSPASGVGGYMVKYI